MFEELNKGNHVRELKVTTRLRFHQKREHQQRKIIRKKLNRTPGVENYNN